MRSGTSLNKEKIKRSFSRSASTYDEYSKVQKRIAAELLAIIVSQKISPKKILDVGTGTGEMAFLLQERFSGATITGCDVAPGMIERARAKSGAKVVSFDIADCESLPYPDTAFDLVVSSSTFQWVEDLKKAFAEIKRVLSDGGLFVFSTFGEGTLSELREAYFRAFEDPSTYFHPYKGADEIKKALSGSGFTDIRVSSGNIREQYSSVKDLLVSIKRVGATNAASELPKGLRSRKKMEELIKFYENKFSSGAGVYVTYKVDYFTAKPYDNH